MTRSPHGHFESLMPFGDHLEELRRRVLYALAAPVPLVILFFIISDPLLVLVLAPVQDALSARGVDATLQVLTPPETLLAKMKLSIVAAVLVSGPWILWQAWLFVAPGLYRKERRFVHFLAPLSGGLSIAGVALLYWVMLPLMLQVLVLFTDNVRFPAPEADRWERRAIELLAEAESIRIVAAVPDDAAEGDAWLLLPAATTQVAVADGEPDANGAVAIRVVDVPTLDRPRIEQPFRVAYVVNFVLALALGVAVAFQLPVVILLAGWLDLVRVDWLRANRRYALLGCAVVSAVTTPADIVSMLLLLVPLYGLYELGVLLLRVVPPARVAGGLWSTPAGQERRAASSTPGDVTDGGGAPRQDAAEAAGSETTPTARSPRTPRTRIVPTCLASFPPTTRSRVAPAIRRRIRGRPATTRRGSDRPHERASEPRSPLSGPPDGPGDRGPEGRGSAETFGLGTGRDGAEEEDRLHVQQRPRRLAARSRPAGGGIPPTRARRLGAGPVRPGDVPVSDEALDRDGGPRCGFVGRPGRRGRPSLGGMVTAVDRAMMERALELADEAAKLGEVPVGAVVYRGSEIVAEGFNLRERTSDPVAHAELLAISEAGRRLGEWRLTDCSLAVTLEPCVMCAGAMVNARVGRLVYGATDPKAGACRSLFEIPEDPRLNHAVEMVTGLMADRASEQLRAFFRRRRDENRAKRKAEKAAVADPRGRQERPLARARAAGGGGVRRSA